MNSPELRLQNGPERSLYYQLILLYKKKKRRVLCKMLAHVTCINFFLAWVLDLGVQKTSLFPQSHITKFKAILASLIISSWYRWNTYSWYQGCCCSIQVLQAELPVSSLEQAFWRWQLTFHPVKWGCQWKGPQRVASSPSTGHDPAHISWGY